MKRLASCVLFLAACGNSTPDNYHDLVADVRDRFCALEVDCGEYPDVATCKSVIFDSPKELTLEAEIEAGRVDYDRSAAADCLDGFGQLSCDKTVVVSSHVLDACDDVLVGHVAIGGACFDSQQCVADARCALPSTCSPGDQCCAGTCESQPPQDEVAVGGDCSQGFNCVDGAYCKSNGTGGFTCTAQVSVEGSACDAFDACLPPLRCNRQQQSGTCFMPAAHGATCDPMVSFASCALQADYCDSASKVCTSRKKPGESCSAADPLACVGYASCDTMAGTCTAVPALGEACAPGQDCLGALLCTSGTCAAPPPADPCGTGG